MNILGIETATNVLGVALTEDRRLITEIRLNFKKAHAEKVIGSIETVLKEAGITLTDLDAVAVSIGPGSFTGLRIGLSTVKGLAFANDLPLAAVNTLDSLASNAMLWRGQICAVIHAQADEAYAALYRSNHFRQERIGDYELLDLNEIRDFIKEKTLLLHSGVKEIGRYLSAADNGLIT
ncbi:tRNA (adenosine(37)-N6)-threonylcarbamoyltransferase complex dimerization subunit type 1 TsaB, partial [candidate division KSB1 bacterium]|nr:tRNA (adenosine(37)-N6)-threonylcarbamoyltransferase complex dimerization subunit type 1 TsaB [candidate division KSB1 bacterium]